MKTTMNQQVRISLAVLCCSVLPVVARAADKPVILGPVRNGASFEGDVPAPSGPMPIGTGLAGGSIFVLFGSGLGPNEIALGAVPYPDQLPSEASGTRVTFRSLENEQVYLAPLIHSLQTQVSGIVPSPLPVGLAEVTVSYDGMESEPTQVAIVEFSPGLFTVSQTGNGPAVVQNYESAVEQPLNTLTHPASPGQYLVLWGTGLGPIDGPDNVSPPAGNLREDVAVWIGTVEVPAEYAGRSPEFPGVDQINVRIPDDGSIEMGCYQDLGIKIGDYGFGAQTSVSISDTPGECDHPWGLPAEKLAELDAGGTMSFVHLTLSEELSQANAAKVNAYGVSQERTSRRQISLPFLSNVIPGVSACSQVISLVGPLPVGPLPIRPVSAGFPLDIGGSLHFAGPGARSFTILQSDVEATAFEPIPDLGEDLLVAGDWTLSAPGGSDVPPFEKAFTIAPLPADILPASVPVNADLDITWDGSAYEEGDRIEIRLQQKPEEPAQPVTHVLLCRAKATVGSLRITTQNLGWIEASAGAPLLWRLSTEGAPREFTAEGLDHGVISVLAFREQAATAE